jgi:hypothetical protein
MMLYKSNPAKPEPNRENERLCHSGQDTGY